MIFLHVTELVGAALAIIGYFTSDSLSFALGAFLVITTQLSLINGNLKSIGENAIKIAERDTHNTMFKHKDTT